MKEEPTINFNLVADNARRIYARTSLKSALDLGRYLILALNDGRYDSLSERIGLQDKLRKVESLSDIPFGTLRQAVHTARIQKTTGFDAGDMRVFTPTHAKRLPLTLSVADLNEWIRRVEEGRWGERKLREELKRTHVSEGGTRAKRTQPRAVKATRRIFKLLCDKTRWTDMSDMTVAERAEVRRMLQVMEGHLQDLIVEAYK